MKKALILALTLGVLTFGFGGVAVAAYVEGTSGNDYLTGTANYDDMSGMAGNDVIYGLGGHDDINGGPGFDEIHGGAGNDVIDANDGHADIIYGGDGVDHAFVDQYDKVYGVEAVN